MSGENDDLLSAFYPGMNPQTAKEISDDDLLTSVQIKVQESLAAKQQFFNDYGDILVQISRTIADAYKAGGRLLTTGNGGSSCDAAHLALEFLHPVTAGRQALPALNLTADVSTITAVANDVGYRHVFVRQLLAQAMPDDVLVIFSTSGNSDNLMAVAQKATELSIKTIGFLGLDGGELQQSGRLTHSLVVECDSVHRIQESHLVAYHILWDLVHTLLANHRIAREIRL
ncbi:D-sedoheptulose-7-phosphate isomerase [Oceanospirillum sediminis]|uniref:SIS domain-containing protein n=1 Tax=Oceanospirillum sediminis TaxID=2760088 RepID=A0A839IVJ4_9GAMM|nr:SIS domain-containing protein [Oceanospirillum sediminis]MBB1488690.1 SIS domain-containing protein [Oceanospirillum sediminis]